MLEADAVELATESEGQATDGEPHMTVAQLGVVEMEPEGWASMA